MEKSFLAFNSRIQKDASDDNVLTAYVSTKSPDRQNEVLMPDGVDLRHYRKNPVVLWAHNYEMPPIGKAVWVKRDDNGVIAKMKFAPTEFAQEIKTLYQEGYLSAFSVGFMPTDFVDGKSPKEPNRTYTKWDMLEFSAVPVPANPEALALAMSKGFLKTKELKEALGVKEEPVQEFDNEEKEVVVEDDTVLKHLQDESDLLLERLNALEKQSEEIISALTKENAELRYKVYQLQKNQSEITVESLDDKIARIFDGVIRRHTGRV